MEWTQLNNVTRPLSGITARVFTYSVVCCSATEQPAVSDRFVAGASHVWWPGVWRVHGYCSRSTRLYWSTDDGWTVQLLLSVSRAGISNIPREFAQPEFWLGGRPGCPKYENMRVPSRNIKILYLLKKVMFGVVGGVGLEVPTPILITPLTHIIKLFILKRL